MIQQIAPRPSILVQRSQDKGFPGTLSVATAPPTPPPRQFLGELEKNTRRSFRFPLWPIRHSWRTCSVLMQRIRKWLLLFVYLVSQYKSIPRVSLPPTHFTRTARIRGEIEGKPEFPVYLLVALWILGHPPNWHWAVLLLTQDVSPPTTTPPQTDIIIYPHLLLWILLLFVLPLRLRWGNLVCLSIGSVSPPVQQGGFLF